MINLRSNFSINILFKLSGINIQINHPHRLYFEHYVFEFCTFVYFSFKHFRLHLIRVFVLHVCKSRSLGTDRKKAKCPWWMKILVLFSTDVQKMKISSWFMVYCRDDKLCFIYSCLSSNIAC
jgi:hypothetical protein